MFKKTLQFYPIYFAIFPTLAFYVANKREVRSEAILVPLVYSLILLLATWVLVKLVVSDKSKTNILVLVALLYFFSYGYFLQKMPVLNKGFLGSLVYTLSFAIILIFLMKFKKKPELPVFLTIIGLYTVGFSLVGIVAYETQRRPVDRFDSDVSKSLPTSVKRNDAPDIYYIILDRYANNRILREQYHFDNKDFFESLRDQGFYVAEDSFANYPKTHLSLASSLNLDYLDDVVKKVGEENSDYTPAFKLVEDNIVAQFLKSSGYRYFYFGDWWGPTSVSRAADKNFNLYANSNEFMRKFLQTTLAALVMGNYYEGNRWFGFFQDRIYENTNYKFEQLEKIAQEKSPKFVFAHMLFPHYPYIFDADCRRVDDQRNRSEDEKYLEQLQCTNKKVQRAITAILQQSKRPPVIIVQSDEGPFATDEMNRDGEKIDWTEVSDAAIERHMLILNAYYLPGFDLEKLYPSLTPVNTFRLIFNHYFGADFKLLPDKSYFIPHLDRPYEYFEITDKVK